MARPGRGRTLRSMEVLLGTALTVAGTALATLVSYAFFRSRLLRPEP